MEHHPDEGPPELKAKVAFHTSEKRSRCAIPEGDYLTTTRAASPVPWPEVVVTPQRPHGKCAGGATTDRQRTHLRLRAQGIVTTGGPHHRPLYELTAPAVQTRRAPSGRLGFPEDAHGTRVSSAAAASPGTLS